jgi:hypothetical protein
MSSAKNIYEIFDEVAKAPTDQDKRGVLIYYNGPILRQVLRAAFHPNIRFVFKEEISYKPSDAPIGLGYSSLDMEFRKIYLFEEGNPRVDPNLSLERRKILLIQILESLEAKEAKVLMDIILKRLNVPGLTKELVLSVFPTLLD